MLAGESSTAAALRVRRCRLKGLRRSPTKIKEAVLDLISSLPDDILQHILSFIQTKIAIKTSLLSKRWRHVWCGTPSLSFYCNRVEAPFINKTLTRYTSSKMMSFKLHTNLSGNTPHLDSWIEFLISRNVENLSMTLWHPCSDEYKFPDFFYINSSVKQLFVELNSADMRIPTCSVSWTSLKKLSLRGCRLSDKYMAKILSGCPILESLTLCSCDSLEVLDLSKSMRLRTLVVERNRLALGPTQIVAPHIHCLILTSSQVSPSTLVDVSSLAEAKLNIFIGPFERPIRAADFLQDMVLKMLAKLQNVEKLAFGEIFLQVLSLAELRGVTFPMFKVKAFTVKTSISQNVIHGIERILQNSPDLKTLTLHIRNGNTIPEVNLDEHVASQGMNPDLCWRSKDGAYWNRSRFDVEPKHVVSFMKLMIKTTKKLEKMIVKL